MPGNDGERPIDVTVGESDAGERLDRFLARSIGISRQRAMALIGAGKVRVGHRRAKKGEPLLAGATVRVEPLEPAGPAPEALLPLVVLHEDPFLVALDKPAGMNMHPLAPGERGTLANAVLARFPDVAGASPEERCPGLVHRLDRETSGVVLWARTPSAFEALRAQFADKTVVKRYWALVEGFVEGAGELDLKLAHDPKNAARMVATPYPREAIAQKARPAVTRYRTLANGERATLLEVEIPTGVMHQIRAHFSFVGHPVVGDALYGAAAGEGVARHLLHAWSIEFAHPDGSGRRTIASPLPDDFRRSLVRMGIAPP